MFPQLRAGLAQNLRALRAFLRLTPAGLARELGWSEAEYVRLERGTICLSDAREKELMDFIRRVVNGAR